MGVEQQQNRLGRECASAGWGFSATGLQQPVVRSGPVRVTNGGGNPGLVVTFTVGSASQGRRGLIK